MSTRFVIAFEKYLSDQGVPQDYVPAYAVLAHRLVQRLGISRLSTLEKTQLEELIRQSRKSGESEKSLRNRLKVGRAVLRFLSESAPTNW